MCLFSFVRNFEYWLEHAIEKSLRVYNALFLSKPFAPPRPEEIKSILICAYHGIGNFILYTPAIDAIKRHFPNARLDLQVGNRTGCEDVLSGAGYFAKTYDVSNKSGWKFWLNHILEIRLVQYDLIISEFHSNSYFLAMMVSFSGAPFRVGHVRSPGWPDRYGFVYNVPVKMEEDQHETDRYFALARALGAPVRLLDKHPFIHMGSDDAVFADQFLSSRNCSLDRPLVGIQMGTSPNMLWKQWQPVRYRTLIIQLLEKYPSTQILMLGSRGEIEMIREWTKGIGDDRIIMCAGETTLKQAAALIKRCSMLVCNDSGLMHVAVAVQTPVVAIYGPTDYRRTAPLGSIHAMIRKGLPCSPCFKMEGDAQVMACPHHDCLNTIEVEEVLKAVEDKLNRER